MDPPGRHLSARLVLPFLDFLEEHLGSRGAVDDLVRRAGGTPAEVRDPESWVSIDFAIRFNELAAHATGDPMISRKAGRAYPVLGRYLGPVYLLFRGAASPMMVYRSLPRFGPLANRAGIWELGPARPGELLISYRPNEGMPDHALLCRNRVGTLEAIPMHFGLPPARVSQESCLSRGDDRCTYHLTWVRRPNGARVLLPLGVVGLAGASAWALATPGLAPLGLLTLAGFAALSGYSVSLWRHQARTARWNAENLESLGAELVAGARKTTGLQLLREVDTRIRDIVDERELLAGTLDPVRETLEYERMALLLREGSWLRLVAASGFTHDELLLLDGLRLPYEHRPGNPLAFRTVMERGQAEVVESDAAYLERVPMRSRIALLGTGAKQFIAAPLVYHGEALGILLANLAAGPGPIGRTEVRLCGRLAGSLALALANARLFADARRREKKLYEALLANQKFAHYLPRPAAEGILRDPHAALELGGQEREVAVLFSDIKGFTPASERARPDQTVAFLNRYFSAMDTIVEKTGGIVDKRMGDGMMVVFLDELAQRHPAERAASCARLMQDGMDALQDAALGAGFKGLSVRVGVNFGRAVAGNIGSPRRMEYTLVGDVVNTAQRLQAHAPTGRVWLSAAAAEHLSSDSCKPVGKVALKGKGRLVEVYELVG